MKADPDPLFPEIALLARYLSAGLSVRGHPSRIQFRTTQRCVLVLIRRILE